VVLAFNRSLPPSVCLFSGGVTTILGVSSLDRVMSGLVPHVYPRVSCVFEALQLSQAIEMLIVLLTDPISI